MKSNSLVNVITLILGIHCAAGSAAAMNNNNLMIAQAITAGLIAPTSWAALIAQEKGASPKVTNGLLILADVNRLLHDALMFYKEQIHNPTLPCTSAWLTATSSTNLLLLVEHIQAFKSATPNHAQDFVTPLDASSSTARKNDPTTALITIGKFMLPLTEALCAYATIESLLLNNWHYYGAEHSFAKFLKSIAQHSNQLLNSKPNSFIRKATIAMLIADYTIFIIAKLEVEKHVLQTTLNDLRSTRVTHNHYDNNHPQQIHELEQQLNNRNQQIQQLRQQINQLQTQQSANQLAGAAQAPEQNTAPCCICLEPYNQALQNKQKITLTCGHDLCRACNNTWFNTQQQYNHACPICREAHCIHLQ